MDNLSVKKLACSEKAKGQIYGKKRWICDEFKRNFIKSANFQSFFGSFGESIFSNLKHLRACDLTIETGAFGQMLSQFDKLENLDLVRVKIRAEPKRSSGRRKSELILAVRNERSSGGFKLTLPSLKSIELEDLDGIVELALDAPKLARIRLWQCRSLKMHIAHAESVESLSTDHLHYLKVEKLKNLICLYSSFSSVSTSLLLSLEHLREVHAYNWAIDELFGLKQRHNRADLKIYYFGLLLNGPSDPVLNEIFDYYDGDIARCYAKNHQRLADEVLFYMWFDYDPIKHTVPKVPVDVWRRFVKMNDIRVRERVGNVQHFLDFLNSFESIEKLFLISSQPPELFDRLSDYCSVQELTISASDLSDLRFLLKLSHLIDLTLNCEVGPELLRSIPKHLKFLSNFSFRFKQSNILIKPSESKLLKVRIGEKKSASFENLNDAIDFIVTDQ